MRPLTVKTLPKETDRSDNLYFTLGELKFKMTDTEDSATGTSRIRTLTEKGKIYQVELLKEQLSSAQRAWRKQMNNVSNVIVDSSNGMF